MCVSKSLCQVLCNFIECTHRLLSRTFVTRECNIARRVGHGSLLRLQFDYLIPNFLVLSDQDLLVMALQGNIVRDKYCLGNSHPLTHGIKFTTTHIILGLKDSWVLLNIGRYLYFREVSLTPLQVHSSRDNTQFSVKIFILFLGTRIHYINNNLLTRTGK